MESERSDTCSLLVDLRPPAAASTLTGSTTCTVAELGPDEPPLPARYARVDKTTAEEEVPRVCMVMTIDSTSRIDSDVALTQAGSVSSFLRLMASVSSDGALTVPPIENISHRLKVESSLTVLRGHLEGSPFKLTGALDCSDPYLKAVDRDGDGYPQCLDGFVNDCDDRNPWVHLDAEEQCLNGIDDDCDGVDCFD